MATRELTPSEQATFNLGVAIGKWVVDRALANPPIREEESLAELEEWAHLEREQVLRGYGFTIDGES